MNLQMNPKNESANESEIESKNDFKSESEINQPTVNIEKIKSKHPELFNVDSTQIITKYAEIFKEIKKLGRLKELYRTYYRNYMDDIKQKKKSLLCLDGEEWTIYYESKIKKKLNKEMILRIPIS